MPETLAVSVAYALPDRQTVVRLTVPVGTTAAQAVASSNLTARFPELAAASHSYAVFGRVVAAHYVLQDGDRVEVLRPLLIDPKESRRQAAARGKTKK